MTLDRTKVPLGTNSTIPNVSWENTFKNKINDLLDNVVSTDVLKTYINGFQIVWVSGKILRIYGGCCASDDGTDFISFPKNKYLELQVTTVGVNGLDKGPITNNSWYYIWAIKHKYTNTVAVLMSLSDTSPILPPNYYSKRLIGAVRYTSAGFRQAFQKGTGNQRDFLYDQRATLISGNQRATGSWGTVNASSVVPTSIYSKIGYFAVYLRGTKSGDPPPTANGTCFAEMAPGDNTSNKPLVRAIMRTSVNFALSGDCAGTAWVKTDSSGDIRYRRNGVSGSDGTPNLSLFCYGFRMNV